MRTTLLDMPVDVLSHAATVDRAVRAMRDGQRCQHVALNVAKLIDAQINPELDRDIRDSDIIGIDGAGISLALRVAGLGAAQRVAGVDLFESLIAVCAKEGFRPFLFGAKPDVVEEAARVLRARYPGLVFAGVQHGYFAEKDEAEIVGRIAASGAHCLFIALPTPRKERFMRRHRDRLKVPFLMGVGGTLDVMAGRVKRAPRLVQAIGCEWLFRLAQEPRRLIGRYARTNTIFFKLLVVLAVKRILGTHRGDVVRSGP